MRVLGKSEGGRAECADAEEDVDCLVTFGTSDLG